MTQQLEQHEHARRAAEEQFRREVMRSLQEGQARLLGDLTKTRDELGKAHRQNEALADRVTELEKPRGLRALWAWLFGRRKKTPAVEVEAEETEAAAVSTSEE
jgi:hypothetical protein